MLFRILGSGTSTTTNTMVTSTPSTRGDRC